LSNKEEETLALFEGGKREKSGKKGRKIVLPEKSGPFTLFWSMKKRQGVAYMQEGKKKERRSISTKKRGNFP